MRSYKFMPNGTTRYDRKVWNENEKRTILNAQDIKRPTKKKKKCRKDEQCRNSFSSMIYVALRDERCLFIICFYFRSVRKLLKNLFGLEKKNKVLLCRTDIVFLSLYSPRSTAKSNETENRTKLSK